MTTVFDSIMKDMDGPIIRPTGATTRLQTTRQPIKVTDSKDLDVSFAKNIAIRRMGEFVYNNVDTNGTPTYITPVTDSYRCGGCGQQAKINKFLGLDCLRPRCPECSKKEQPKSALYVPVKKKAGGYGVLRDCSVNAICACGGKWSPCWKLSDIIEKVPACETVPIQGFGIKGRLATVWIYRTGQDLTAMDLGGLFPDDVAFRDCGILLRPGCDDEGPAVIQAVMSPPKLKSNERDPSSGGAASNGGSSVAKRSREETHGKPPKRSFNRSEASLSPRETLEPSKSMISPKKSLISPRVKSGGASVEKGAGSPVSGEIFDFAEAVLGSAQGEAAASSKGSPRAVAGIGAAPNERDTVKATIAAIEHKHAVASARMAELEAEKQTLVERIKTFDVMILGLKTIFNCASD